MKNKDFEKYISELSPELQEKARQCTDAEELNRLLAENDVELSEDTLATVAGGGSCSDSSYSQGQITEYRCPECYQPVYYWDRTYSDGNRYYCNNSSCKICQEHRLLRHKDIIGDENQTELLQ